MIKRIILYSILSILLLLIATATFISTTTTGLKLAINISTKFIPGQLSVGQISGRLISSMEFQNISYTNAQLSTHIQDIQLAWSPLDLIHRTIHIKKIVIQNTSINQLNNPKNSQTITKSSDHDLMKFLETGIALPLNIQIDDGQVTSVVFNQQNKTSMVVQKLQLNLFTKDQTIHLQQLSLLAEPYDLTLSGSMQVASPFTTKLLGHLTTKAPGLQTIQTDLDLNGNIKDQYVLNITNQKPYQAKLSATIKKPMSHDASINIQGNWNNLFFPIGETDTITSDEGSISIQGPLKNYSVSIKSNLAGSNIPASNIQIQGSGNLQTLNLSKLSIATLGGSFNGAITFAWKPSFSWDGQITAKNINPGIKWPDWIGSMNAKFITKGEIAEKQHNIWLQVNQMHGNLHKHPISGYFEARYVNNLLSISRSHFKIGDDFFKISGNLIDQWNFHWQIKAPNVTEAFPSATGSVFSDGVISGQNKTPLIKGNFNIQDFLVRKIHIKQLLGTININFKPRGISNLKLAGKNLYLNQYLINQLDMNLSGHIYQHTFSTKLHVDGSTLSLLLSGGLKDDVWNGNIQQLNIDSPNESSWVLQSPISIQASPTQLIIQPFVWHSAKGRVSGEVNWQQDKNLFVQISARDIPTLIFEHFVPLDIQLDSAINADVQLKSQKDLRLSGHAKLSSSTGKMIYNSDQTIPYHGFDFFAQFDQKGLSAQLSSQNQNKKLVDAALTLPDYYGKTLPKKDQKIKGQVNIDLSNLKFLSALIPDVSNTNGEITSKLNVAGTLHQPDLTGQVALKNGEVQVAKLGIHPKPINLLITLPGSNKITLTGSIESGNGSVKLSGESTLNGFSPAKIKIEGQHFLAVNNSEYQLFVSPDLTVTYQKPQLTLSGQLTIPKAYISPKDFTNVVTLPQNVIIENGEEDGHLQSIIEFYLDLKLILGDNVDVQFSGLSAKLGGALQINSSPRQITTALGSLNINQGQYVAYGEKLTIEKGTLIYTGGTIANPGINLRAIKVVSGASELPTSTNRTSVGVQVTGTMTTPKLTLFSEPAGMSQSNILAYLLLGTSANEASGSQAQMLLKAADAMGMGGTSLTNDIQHSFGLSEFGIGSQSVEGEDGDAGTTQNPSFVIGKYITPKLYLNYSVGLLVPVNILQLRYLINRRLSIQSETSTRGNGVDLLYSFESN